MIRVFVFAIIWSSFAFGDTVLTNVPAWNGADTVLSWGSGGLGTPTYGETIVAPVNGNNRLDSFTFFIFGGDPSIDFNAYVQNWNGAETTGTPLFAGGPEAVSTALGATSYTFAPQIDLAGGGAYVLYFSTLGISQANDHALGWGGTRSDTYAPGGFVFTNVDTSSTAAGNVADLNGSAWTTSFTGISDLAFSATFSGATEVPEPEAVGFAAAMVGMLLMVWRVTSTSGRPKIRR